MKLLLRRDQALQARRRRLQAETRRELRAVLTELLPGERIYLFGSLVRLGRFHDRSDIDLAWVGRDGLRSEYGLAVEISERMRRPVDLVILERSRLREKIMREGELWTL